MCDLPRLKYELRTDAALGSTMDDAELLRALQARLVGNAQSAAAPLRDLPTALDEFKAWLYARGKTEGTVTTYRAVLLTMHRQGLRLLSLDAAHVIDFASRTAQRLSARTVGQRYSALRAWAEFTGQAHAVGALKAPTIDPTPQPLPPVEDVVALRSVMRPSKHAHDRDALLRRRDGTIFDLLFEGALRISEVLALDVTDLKIRRGTGYSDWSPSSSDAVTHVWVRKSKRNKSRTVPLTPLASKSLMNWVRVHRPKWNPVGGPVVFTSQPGERLDSKVYRHRLVHYAKEANVTTINGKTHMGRRFKITSLIVKGKAPSALIRFTGHNSTKELQPYIVWDEADAEREWLD